MPDSVSAMSCSRLSGFFPGRMLMLVMRIIGSRFQLSARCVPPERFAPIVCAVSRELRYPVKRPLVIIGNNIHQIAAVAKIAQLVEREKGSSGKIGFHPENTIKLDGMPDRFVNL